jgi:hypothetical protein
MNAAELFDSLPQEIKDEMRRVAKEKFHDDRSIIEFLEFEEDLSTINNQLCNTLGMMKQILERFDENGTSTEKAMDNLRFFAKFMLLTAMPLRSLNENIDAFKNKHGNKRNGENNEG